MMFLKTREPLFKFRAAIPTFFSQVPKPTAPFRSGGDSDGSSDDGLSIGAIIGIAVGVPAGIAVVSMLIGLAFAFHVLSRRRRMLQPYLTGR